MKFESAQTYILVTLITLLIWLYAESENVVQRSARINVQLVSPESYAILDETSGGLPTRETSKLQSVEIVYEAASSVRSEILRLSQAREIRLELNPLPNETDVTVSLREELNRLPIFIERGARIEASQPSTVSLRVEELVTREIPVEVLTQELVLVSEPKPKVEPEKISVVMPKSLSEKLPDLKAEAALDQLDGIDKLPANLPQKNGSACDDLQIGGGVFCHDQF